MQARIITIFTAVPQRPAQGSPLHLESQASSLLGGHGVITPMILYYFLLN